MTYARTQNPTDQHPGDSRPDGCPDAQRDSWLVVRRILTVYWGRASKLSIASSLARLTCTLQHPPTVTRRPVASVNRTLSAANSWLDSPSVSATAVR